MNKYLIPIISDGIVTFIGDKEDFNNTVIIILEKLAEGGLDSGIQKNFNCAQKVLI